MSTSIPPTHKRRKAPRADMSTSSSRDASEEDNGPENGDDMEDDASSAVSVNAALAPRSTSIPPSPFKALPGKRQTSGSSVLGAGAGEHPTTASRALGGELQQQEVAGNQSEGTESQTYDGDVESAATVLPSNPTHHSHPHPHSHTHTHAHPHVHSKASNVPSHGASHSISSNSSFSSPPEPTSARMPKPKSGDLRSDAVASNSETFAAPVPPVVVSNSSSQETAGGKQPTFVLSAATNDPSTEKAIATLTVSPPTNAPLPAAPQVGPPKMMTPPKWLSEENIRGFVRRAVEGKGAEDGVIRNFKANEPPTDRPVRIYADGVYDLFHFGHALQLRQAKLCFPNVHLIVGVNSDEQCAEHKSAPAMSHAERMESVKHCRWVDEIAPEAPWVVDQAWLERYQIDYVAHDEMVYPGGGHLDVYDFVKKQGRFIPTRRTPSISTSDLLERIVRGYRDGFFDSKLEKNGHPELIAADVDWDSSASVERKARRKAANDAEAARVKR